MHEYTYDELTNPENTIHLPNADLVLVQRRRRWTNTKSALGKCIVFAGKDLQVCARQFKSVAVRCILMASNHGTDLLQVTN